MLDLAVSYDRLTGYFNIAGLLTIARGIESLWRRGGRMRLILGIHDVPAELAEAGAKQGEWADELIAAVRERLLSQVSTLRDELYRDRIATLAWMIHEGLLEAKVAAPRTAREIGDLRAIFHSKRLILRDEAGDIVSASGSQNETMQGMGRNFEELTVHMSWQDSLGYVDRHRESFEKIWNNDRPELVVRALDAAFADELLSHAGRPRFIAPPPKIGVGSRHVRELLDVARRMRSLAVFNQGPAALYPHQERVFVDALGRWPVRALLADEVGLGKTLEAGSIISYMIRFAGVRRVLVLAPAGVTRQWQEELDLHFGLDAWRYESGFRAFERLDGATQTVHPGQGPIGSHTPDLTIVSVQLARGSRGSGHAFDGCDQLPELLIVDEAHAARVRPDLQGRVRPTLIWRMLNDIKDQIPHLILVTATPMQVHWAEFHALLNLLGVPEKWQRDANYERSLKVLSKGDSQPSLDEAALAAELSLASLTEMEPKDLVSGDQGVAMPEGESRVQRGVRARQDWPTAFTTFVRSHPANLLTTRNTRSALEAYGYRFPQRNLHAPPLDVPAEISSFYAIVQDYLADAYGTVEAAALPGRRRDFGFAASSFHQRLASSLYACRVSLSRRLAKIEAIAEGRVASDEPTDDDVDLEEDEALPQMPEEVGAAAAKEVLRCFTIERSYITTLLDHLDRLEAGRDQPDPKLVKLIELVSDHVPDDQVLVFSRYTDTLVACLSAFLDRYGSNPVPGHGMYTGGECWIDIGDGPVPATKQGVKAALDDGTISVVFCSEAASEGLNLQAARVLINVDVPWNPARLEQRIGRIARLGQQAKEVEIYNLWYPDSVEAKIYSRLLQRKELYELAVGEFPELISEAIKQEVAARFGHGDGVYLDDPLVRLRELRGQEQHVALAKVWGGDPEGLPGSTRFRSELVSIIVEALGDGTLSEGRATTLIDGEHVTLDTEPGQPGSVTLTHPALDTLEPTAPPSRDAAELGVVEVGDIPVGFFVQTTEGRAAIPCDAFPALLRSVVLGTAFAPPDSLSDATDTDLANELSRSVWEPDHSRLRVPYEGDIPLLPSGDARTRILCPLPVRET